MNLLALHGARDFRLQDNIQFHELDDHHIFLQAYLRKLNGKDGNSKYKDSKINSIANKTLISASTNRKISKKSPSSYLKDDSIISQSDTQDILKRHFINKEAYEFMLNDDYDSFLIARNELIVRLVKSLLEI
ncbi:hypothetical protein A3I51_03930 [Candidatus Gottesmanbacteria bacterium RIFCSPLOWO2_02_FULL_38_8]|uniref:Uncharacterized protein n=1 Tax=Candidatus Gottesmanbacteria bacterium RIFCSPLOWO2_02_FULL_38_8 TaxID=1798397 RepID=A0A1F6B362_9BACT|nr:MAG: hypothetical protein A3I51_03930 [Candidatus Gottesmanbacteria bacterium RIFCSPLOWO2_02_FULL_38_8]